MRRSTCMRPFSRSTLFTVTYVTLCHVFFSLVIDSARFFFKGPVAFKSQSGWRVAVASAAPPAPAAAPDPPPAAPPRPGSRRSPRRPSPPLPPRCSAARRGPRRRFRAPGVHVEPTQQVCQVSPFPLPAFRARVVRGAARDPDRGIRGGGRVAAAFGLGGGGGGDCFVVADGGDERLRDLDGALEQRVVVHAARLNHPRERVQVVLARLAQLVERLSLLRGHRRAPAPRVRAHVKEDLGGGGAGVQPLRQTRRRRAGIGRPRDVCRSAMSTRRRAVWSCGLRVEGAVLARASRGRR